MYTIGAMDLLQLQRMYGGVPNRHAFSGATTLAPVTPAATP